MPSSTHNLHGPARTRILALIAMMIMVHTAFTGGRVAMSLYAIQQHANTLTVGFIVACLSIVPMLISVHLGRWTDRVGITAPALISMVGVAIGVALPAVYESIAMLYVSSLILGSSFMVMHIGANNAVGHASSPQTRTQAFSWLAIGFSISSILGPVVAGFAIDHVGHARSFVVLAMFPLLALAVFLLRRPNADPPEINTERPAGAHVMDLLRDPKMRAVFIASGMLSMSWDMFTFMVPVQGARIGLSASLIGILMGSFGVATFVVRLSLSWVSKRFTEWQVLTFALGTSAIGYGLFPLFNSFPVLMVLAFFLGIGLGSAQPMVLSLIHRVAPPGRTGEAIGVRTSFLNSSQVIMPLLLGGMGVAAGMVPAFWAIAAVLSAGTWFTGRIGKKFGQMP